MSLFHRPNKPEKLIKALYVYQRRERQEHVYQWRLGGWQKQQERRSLQSHR